MPTEAPRAQPFFKVKEGNDNDRVMLTAPSVRPGGIYISPPDAALLIDYLIRQRHKEAWMIDVLTHGSREYRTNN